MSTVSVRLPGSIYEKSKEVAERDGISVDQFVASAAAEKLAAFLSDDYLEQRARRGGREAFERVLAKIPAIPRSRRRDLTMEPGAGRGGDHRESRRLRGSA
jgi:hypothetical protein